MKKCFTHLMLLMFWCCVAVAAPPMVLPETGVAHLNLGVPAAAEPLAVRETVDALHPAFDQALRVTVRQPSEHVHQIQVNQLSVLDLAADDVLRVRITLRSGDESGAALRLPFYVQDREQGFRSIFNRDLVAGREWEDIVFRFPVPEDMSAGRLQFCLFLGGERQIVEIGRFEVVNLGAQSEADVLPADAVHKIPVQGAFEEIDTSRDTITGALPAGWEEDSAWADVVVHYRPQTVNPYAGDQSLRAEVREVRQGTVQFRVPDILVVPSHLIRIRIPVRSEDHLSGTISLRQRGEPYATYWSAPLPARPEWGMTEFLASVRDTDPEAVLMFSLNSPGTFELSDVTLEYLTPDQALADMSFEGNLLQTSSFPLGLSAPWASGANGTTEEHLAADPGQLGPSGLPALRLTPNTYEGRPMIQITSPFVGQPGEVHTFSFWAKSEAPGMNLFLRMGPPQESLWTGPWQTTLSLSTEWQRVSFSVTLPPAPDMVYLARITSHDTGTFWIDQAMVAVGEDPGTFQRTGDIELHAVPEKDWGLHFEADPMALRLALYGDTASVTRIRATLLDLYGRESDLPPLMLQPDMNLTSLPYTLPAQSELGSFLVTLQAETEEGESIGKPAEVLLHRVREPRYWGRSAPESPFGTHVASIPSAVQMGKALGFNWNRMHYKFNWSSVQGRDGSWNLANADRLIAPHRDQHMLILTHFGGVPAAQSTVAPHWTGSSWYRMTAAPRMDSMDAFEEYARRLLAHAGEHLQAVETWNEPFLPGFFVADVQDGRPVRAQPEVLLEMHRRARRAAEAAGYTGNLMWNTGPHYGDSERGFDEAVRDLGGTDYVDALSFHRYTNTRLGFAGDQFDRDLRIIRETFAGQPAAERIWNSEGGHGLSEVFNLYRNVPPFRMRSRADAQAAQYVRYFLSNFAAGAEKVFIYTFYPMDGWVSNYGYMNVDGTLSQIAPATSNMAWHLEGKQFVTQEALDDSVYAQRYVGETETTVVLLPSGRGAVRLFHQPEGVKVADLYGNPVETPHGFGAGVLYLRAPALTLAQVRELLQEAPPVSFPPATAEQDPAAQPAESDTVSPPTGVMLLLGLGGLVLVVCLMRACRGKR